MPGPDGDTSAGVEVPAPAGEGVAGTAGVDEAAL